MRHTTLCFLEKDDEILLAMKKRGFGIGRWNGVGGKVGPGETVEESAVREIKEEISVDVSVDDLKLVAILFFTFINKPEWDQEVRVFMISKWEGMPSESEEMKPQWYKKVSPPFSSMWEDDPHWLPRVIKGERIEGRFTFDENQKMLDGFSVRRLVE